MDIGPRGARFSAGVIAQSPCPSERDAGATTLALSHFRPGASLPMQKG
jgi:hypothetical protein